MTAILRYARIAGACAIITLLSAGQTRAQAPEPSMAEYTHYPLFQTGAVAPRVMIILDNSGSMNFPAYGDTLETWPWGGTITGPYQGRVCSEFYGRVSSSTDDGQQQKNTGEIILCNGNDARYLFDIDLGKDDDTYSNRVGSRWVACSTKEAMMAAVRFADVGVPREVDGVPVVVSRAYIEFTARTNDGGNTHKRAALTLKITAQAADNPLTLGSANHNISSRPDTAASVTWNVLGTAANEWVNGSTYTTPDLTPIVQELINRPGWNDGQAMLFKIDWVSGNGGRTAHSFDSNASLAPRLVIEYAPCRVTTYYGYFDPDSRYRYGSNVFVRDASGPWDGNFLNFISMRRGDVLKKALVGGLSTSRTGGGNATQIGITDNTSKHGDYRKHHAKGGVSPWSDAWYFMTNGEIQVKMSDQWTATPTATFTIKVEKDEIAEANDFGPDGELAGVLQKVGDRAQWGNAYFLGGSDLTKGKAEIAYPMGTNMTNMVTTMKNKSFNTNTPLAEALYVVTQYFKQQDSEITGYPNSAIGPFNDTRDPYRSKKDATIEETCAQGFCLLLTDGMSTKDQRIPDYLKGFDTTQNPLIEHFDNDGTSFARDVALYMRTTDLRSLTVGKDNLPGVQNIILYVVYALGNNDDARRLLQQVAINGGFYDSNNNNLPDIQSEWDKNNDGIPDNYFEARDGKQLEQQLMNAILAILQRAGSGTAVSVLATKGEGEGTLVQAIFNPSEATLEGEVKWTGMLHALWVDDHGQMREDTVSDYKLDTNADDRILFTVDANTGDTVIQRFRGDEEEPYDPSVKMEDLRAIWSAGKKLAETDPLFRKIFTYRGDGTEADPNLNFIPLGGYWDLLSIMNYLGVNDNTAWSYLGPDEIARAWNLMEWIKGVPDYDSSYYGTVSLRHRTLNDGTLWKLGDIINSTPTSTAQPLADYDLLYSDSSYFDYYMKNRKRETVVYVGSNAGMLHAFTGWVYDGDTFKNPYDITDYFKYRSDNSAGNVDIGKELWAYIPQCLLPHLKWLADKEYSHVNYVDLRPRVFDAKIFTPSPQHPNGWGSVLVCGLGFAAGMEIPVNPNHPDLAKRLTMNPSFFAIDVTDPRSPALLWERSFPNLGMSSNYPNLMKVGDNWMLAIGSGPSSQTGVGGGMEGSANHAASLIVVDLKTGGDTANGGLKNIFTLPGGNAFANEPVALDKNMNYNADAVYVAANYNDETSRVFRLTIPQKDTAEFKPWGADGTPPEYIDNPADPKWTITNLFKSPRPITSSASLSIDRKDNAWVYLGTGRYLSQADKTTDDQNYLIGIKDPFFNRDLPDCNYSYPAVTCEINTLGTFSDLFDADEYTVYGRADVKGPNGTVSFDNMLTEARRNVYQGWYRRLLREEESPSERVVNKGALLGGLLLKPTFTPSPDPCGFGGTSRLYAVYYETGTAFFRKVFMQDTGEGPIMDVIDLGDGLASSLSMHSGRQQGGKVYVQKSTGEILEVDVDPPFSIKPGPLHWLDDGYY